MDMHAATEQRTNHIDITTALAGRSRKAWQSETNLSKRLTNYRNQSHRTRDYITLVVNLLRVLTCETFQTNMTTRWSCRRPAWTCPPLPDQRRLGAHNKIFHCRRIEKNDADY
jgi:hypothetical protein